jgi:CHAD domain-containing protein
MHTNLHTDAYLKSLLKNISKILKKRRWNEKAENVHQLRINTKKLKAFLDLLKYLFPKIKSKKILRPFKKIFKQSGKVRDLQLAASSLKKEDVMPTGYFHELDARIQKEQKKLRRMNNNKLAKQMNKAIKKATSFDISGHTDQIGEYLLMQQHEIASMALQNLSDTAHIHELRKRLKSYYYNSKAIDPDNEKKLDKTNQLQDQLGKWHDERTLNDHLEKNIIQYQDQAMILQPLTEMRTKVLAKADNLLSDAGNINPHR